MSRFRIDHPRRKDIHAEAGHDPVLGFFVDVMSEGRDRPVKAYDHFNPAFNRERPLRGCLDFLVAEGFMTASQLEAALVYLQDGSPKPRNMRIVEIIELFKDG